LSALFLASEAAKPDKNARNRCLRAFSGAGTADFQSGYADFGRVPCFQGRFWYPDRFFQAKFATRFRFG
jgi:hypothetical protein